MKTLYYTHTYMNRFTRESSNIKKKNPQSHIYRHLQDQGPRINMKSTSFNLHNSQN